MATLKIPYKGVSYPLYLTPTKETTPALKVGNLGYAFLAQGKALGDPMLHGSSILKGAPLKITKDGTSYRSISMVFLVILPAMFTIRLLILYTKVLRL